MRTSVASSSECCLFSFYQILYMRIASEVLLVHKSKKGSFYGISHLIKHSYLEILLYQSGRDGSPEPLQILNAWRFLEVRISLYLLSRHIHLITCSSMLLDALSNSKRGNLQDLFLLNFKQKLKDKEAQRNDHFGSRTLIISEEKLEKTASR